MRSEVSGDGVRRALVVYMATGGWVMTGLVSGLQSLETSCCIVRR